MLAGIYSIIHKVVHFSMFSMFCIIYSSVVILVLNPRKSGQIANKGFMIYYGRYRSQLAILKSPKQNSCSNLLNCQTVSQPWVYNVMKK